MTITNPESALDDIPQLLAHSIAWVFNFEVPSLSDNLFCCERSLGEPPSRVSPPLLHAVDVRLVKLLFMV